MNIKPETRMVSAYHIEKPLADRVALIMSRLGWTKRQMHHEALADWCCANGKPVGDGLTVGERFKHNQWETLVRSRIKAQRERERHGVPESVGGDFC
jgi:hypothetical protein